MAGTLSRHSPDDSRTGVNSNDFLAPCKPDASCGRLPAQRAAKTAARGVDLAICLRGRGEARGKLRPKRPAGRTAAKSRKIDELLHNDPVSLVREYGPLKKSYAPSPLVP